MAARVRVWLGLGLQREREREQVSTRERERGVAAGARSSTLNAVRSRWSSGERRPCRALEVRDDGTFIHNPLPPISSLFFAFSLLPFSENI